MWATIATIENCPYDYSPCSCDSFGFGYIFVACDSVAKADVAAAFQS